MRGQETRGIPAAIRTARLGPAARSGQGADRAVARNLSNGIVSRIRDINISRSVNCNSSGRLKTGVRPGAIGAAREHRAVHCETLRYWLC